MTNPTGTEVLDPATPAAGSAIAAQYREYLESIITDYRAAWGKDSSFEARLAWQKLLAAGGWAAPSWPIEHGGRGLDVLDRVACDAELSRVDAPMAAGVLGLQNVGPALMMFGTEEQKKSLPRILDGTEIWAQGFSEPGAGSDLAALTTRADLVDGEFIVNGQKVWTSDGMNATHSLLLVRTDRDAPKHKGITALLVDLNSPGIERRPIKQLTGESGFAELYFTDVRVPEANLFGPLHQGWYVTMKTLGYERTGVINMASKLEREVQRSLGAFTDLDELTRDRLVERYMEAKLLGLMGARVLAKLGAGGEPGATESIIKFGWSMATAKLGETLMDASGPQALLEGNAYTQQFLQSRSSTIAAGTTEVLKNLLAERVLGLPKG